MAKKGFFVPAAMAGILVFAVVAGTSGDDKEPVNQQREYRSCVGVQSGQTDVQHRCMREVWGRVIAPTDREWMCAWMGTGECPIVGPPGGTK